MIGFEALRTLRKFVELQDARGRPPSIRELGRAMGRHSSNASQHLVKARYAGLIEWEHGAVRARSLTPAAFEWLPVVMPCRRCGVRVEHTRAPTPRCAVPLRVYRATPHGSCG